MPITDTWGSWSSTANNNSPAGTAVPEIDDELRNVKAQLIINCVTLTGNQTIAGIKTFSSIPVLPGTDCASDNQAARKSYVDSAISSGLESLIESGTKMLFLQAAAPTGWTQDTSMNDKVLRIVDNTGTGAGTGGAWTISGITVNNHTLTTSEIPAHTHSYVWDDASYPVTNPVGIGFANSLEVPSNVQITDGASGNTGSLGGGQGHNHNLTIDGNWRPAYVNAIIATRN